MFIVNFYTRDDDGNTYVYQRARFENEQYHMAAALIENYTPLDEHDFCSDLPGYRP